MHIKIIRGDITRVAVDMIVNAANDRLLPGGGVCGAIHRAAGPQLAEACAQLGACPTGSARVTPAFRLPAHWVAHAVGPVWKGGQFDEVDQLADCYRQCLQLAKAHGAQSISFPAISTGIYGFPIELATAIVFDVLKAHSTHAIDVHLICFSEEDHTVYQRMCTDIFPEASLSSAAGGYQSWASEQTPVTPRATINSWKTIPMTDRSAEFKLEKTFTDDEMARIQRGYIPQGMEEKWFIYWADDVLHFHRSWGGHCIFTATFEGNTLRRVRACRDDDIYSWTSDDRDGRQVLALIRGTLFNRSSAN